MNIIFKKITLQNFQSYGNIPTEINLDRKNTTAIYGVNNDVGDEGESTNGVGKSSCINALQWVLSGKLEGASSDELINNKNKKNMKVTLDFVVGTDEYQIVRGRKPNVLSLTKNGESKTLDTMANTSKAIEDILGIPCDVFDMVYGLHSHKPLFFSLKPAQQRDVMESVLQINVLTERAEAVKKMISDAKIEVKLAERDLQNQITIAESAERTISQLVEKADRFEEQKNSKLRELKNRRTELKAIDYDELLAVCEKISEVESELDAMDNQNKDNERTLASAKREKESLQREISTILDTEERNRKRNKDSIEKLDAAREKLKTLKTFDELDEQDSRHDHLDKLDKKAKELVEKQNKIQKEGEVYLKKIDALNKQIESLESGVCYTCNQKHFDQDAIDALTAEKDEQVEALSKTADLEEDIINELKKVEQDTLSAPAVDHDRRTIDAMRSERKSLESTIAALESAVGNIDEEHDVSAQIAEIEKKITEVSSTIDFAIDQIESDYELMEIKEEELGELKKQTKGLTDSKLTAMKRESIDINARIGEEEERENPYIEQIEQHRESIPHLDAYEDALNDAEKYLTHLNYVVKLLTDSKSFVRKNIIDRYIPYFNSKILEYCQELDFPHIVKINSDLTTELTSMGEPLSPRLLSGGEKNRLNAATTAAFMDLLGTMGFKSNVLMVDELFDSALDASGVRKTFDFLKRKVDTFFLITHRDDLSTLSDERLIVTKTNGFSEIELG